jgi:hypothetical protein
MDYINIELFVKSYLATAAWVSCDSNENQEFDKLATKQATQDCEEFINRCIREIGNDQAIELLSYPGDDLEYLAAHCFFLNRCGHGTGFWDRQIEFGDYADTLSDISRGMGNVEVLHKRYKNSKLIFA